MSPYYFEIFYIKRFDVDSGSAVVSNYILVVPLRNV